MDTQPLNIQQAAEVLGMSPWTLRDRVTARTVPHHRSGKVRGVRFYPEHIEAIKAELHQPALGTPSRADARVRSAARTTKRGKRAA